MQKGETLIGIAVKYGLSLDALLAANPGLVPEALSVGSSLVIPAGPGSAAASAVGAVPTPLPMVLSTVACFDQAGGGRYCLLEAKNPNESALEAVQAQVVLAGGDGQVLAEAAAQPALRAIGPGASVPLVAFFPAVPAGVAAVGVFPVSAMPVGAAGDRYLALTVQAQGSDLTRPVVELRGTVGNPAAVPVKVRLAAALYDGSGQLAGCGWLELPAPLEVGQSLPFTLPVAVLGNAPVSRSVVWGEGRP